MKKEINQLTVRREVEEVINNIPRGGCLYIILKGKYKHTARKEGMYPNFIKCNSIEEGLEELDKNISLG